MARVGAAPSKRARAAGAALAVAAGGFVAVSLPPFSLWPLAFVGITLLAVLLVRQRPATRALFGLCAGIGQFAPGCAWALHFTGAGYVGLVALESAFVALACAIAPSGPLFAPALAGALTTAEWARDSWPFGGVPLGGIALGQAAGPMLAFARLGGPLLVAGAVFLTGAVFASAIRPGSDRRRAVAAALVGFASLGALGVLAALAPAGGPALGRIAAVAVQGGRTSQSTALLPAAVQTLDATLAESRLVARGPSLVVWPEDVVALGGPLAGSAGLALLGGEARRLHATLLAGVTRPAGPGRFANEIVALAPSGKVVATFEKVHRVPFGEYVPDRAVFARLASLAAVPLDAVAGRASGMVATPAGRLALLVSYETFFPLRGRAGVDAGGEALVVATNTASYATEQVPSQELAASRLQAVSTGRDLLQAASTGISAAISSDGAVLGSSVIGRAALVRATLALRNGRTPYDVAGDTPVLVLAVVAWSAGVVLGPWRRRRRRGVSQGASAEEA